MFSEETFYSTLFGKITESQVAGVFRAIGYLARVLRDDDESEKAAAAVAKLHERAAAFSPETDRSLVVAVTTALGFLGEWRPILTHLGPREPWMHEAADNVFTHWVPKSEWEDAARWIALRLRDGPELAPEVRSTLGKLLERLEREIGHHIELDEEP